MTLVLAEPQFASERVDLSGDDETLIHSWNSELESLWESSVSYFDEGVSFCSIDELEQGYEVLVPISVTIQRIDDRTFEASFDGANIAITGEDAQDAYQSLVAEILDTFDTLIAEPNLGRDAATQLEVLRRHIAKA
jgi:hypothetical protein